MSVLIRTPEMQRVEARHDGKPIDAILRELYIDQGLTLEQVGEKLAGDLGRPLTKGAVSDWLTRCGIPTRRPGQRGIEAA